MMLSADDRAALVADARADAAWHAEHGSLTTAGLLGRLADALVAAPVFVGLIARADPPVEMSLDRPALLAGVDVPWFDVTVDVVGGARFTMEARDVRATWDPGTVVPAPPAPPWPAFVAAGALSRYRIEYHDDDGNRSTTEVVAASALTAEADFLKSAQAAGRRLWCDRTSWVGPA